jgi:hypothetical protein
MVVPQRCRSAVRVVPREAMLLLCNQSSDEVQTYRILSHETPF